MGFVFFLPRGRRAMMALWMATVVVALLGGVSARTYQIDVRPQGNTAYLLTNSELDLFGGPNEAIRNVFPGDVLIFNVDAPTHPFAIHTSQGNTATSNRWMGGGVQNQGTEVGTVTFTIPDSAPNVLWYQCEAHGAQTGSITIGLAAASETGVVSYRKQLAGQSHPNFEAPCCSAIYRDTATLTVTRTSINYTVPGTTGSCGATVAGWVAVSGLTYVSGSCYVGDLVAGNAVGSASFGKGRICWNPSTKELRTAVYGNGETVDCAFAVQDTLGCAGANSTFNQPIAGCFASTGCPVACSPCNVDSAPTTTAPSGPGGGNMGASAAVPAFLALWALVALAVAL